MLLGEGRGLFSQFFGYFLVREIRSGSGRGLGEAIWELVTREIDNGRDSLLRYFEVGDVIRVLYVGGRVILATSTGREGSVVTGGRGVLSLVVVRGWSQRTYVVPRDRG